MEPLIAQIRVNKLALIISCIKSSISIVFIVNITNKPLSSFQISQSPPFNPQEMPFHRKASCKLLNISVHVKCEIIKT